LKIPINFHDAAVQRINFPLISTLTQIGVKIQINLNAVAVQGIDFPLIFTLTQIRVKSELNFTPPQFSELIFN